MTLGQERSKHSFHKIGTNIRRSTRRSNSKGKRSAHLEGQGVALAAVDQVSQLPGVLARRSAAAAALAAAARTGRKPAVCSAGVQGSAMADAMPM